MQQTENKNSNSKKIAVFYAFLKCQGGGERLMFTIRDYFKADFWTGAVDSSIYSPSQQNSFSKHLFNSSTKFISFHEDSKIPLWYIIKRQLYFLFSPKIEELAKYDEVIISGNVSFIASRLKKIAKKNNHQIKLTAFVHTPPRKFTDQKDIILDKFPSFCRPIVDKLLKTILKYGYTNDLKLMDKVYTNSKNIQKRLLDYTGINSDWIFPPADLDRFKYISTGDYFISYSRLEDAKRIKLLVKTFQNLPDKKLIICSTGPLKDWVIDNIKNYPNIQYKGLVTDEELANLVGNSLAGITIPIDEDAGITQLEIMAASKPVIGVAEGGILETVIDQETGILIKSNPNIEDLTNAINSMTPDLALQMKEKSRKQAENYSIEKFFQKWQ